MKPEATHPLARLRATLRLLAKVGRLAAFLSVVFLVLGLLAVRSTLADVEEAALAAGAELGKLGDAGSEQTLRLNGQPLQVVARTEDVEMTALLDRFEAYCRAETSGLADGYDALPEALRGELGSGTRRAAAAVMREDRVDRGFVACLVRPGETREAGLAELLDRTATFADTGDLAAFGRLRYLFAKRAPEGRTFTVLAYSDSSFSLGALAPEGGGDAAGSDPVLAPRPPGSTRLFTAAVDGVPYGVRLYESDERPEPLLARYGEALEGRGFALLARDPDGGGLAYGRADGDVWVTASADGGRSVVSVVELLARRPTTATPSP